MPTKFGIPLEPGIQGLAGEPPPVEAVVPADVVSVRPRIDDGSAVDPVPVDPAEVVDETVVGEAVVRPGTREVVVVPGDDPPVPEELVPEEPVPELPALDPLPVDPLPEVLPDVVPPPPGSPGGSVGSVGGAEVEPLDGSSEVGSPDGESVGWVV